MRKGVERINLFFYTNNLDFDAQENKKQLQFLNEHGCDEVQGFLYSNPLPAEEIKTKLLAVES